MEKRTIIAIVLTFLIIFLWSFIQSKFFPHPSQPPPKEAKKEEAPPRREEIGVVKASKVEKGPGEREVIPGKDVSVETRDFWAVFTSEDARLKHFKLKEYEDRVEQSAITIKLRRFVEGLFGKTVEEPGKPEPLDLVNTKGEALPLGLSFEPSLPRENWEVDRDQLRLLRAREKGEVTFTRTFENGLKVVKRYFFQPEGYDVKLEVEVQNLSQKEMAFQLGLDWIGKVEVEKLIDEDNKDYGLKYAFLKNNKVERKSLGGTTSSGCTPSCSPRKRNIEPFNLSDKGEIKWYAFEGEYFAALLVSPLSEKEMTLAIRGDDKNLVKSTLFVPSFSLQPRESLKIPYQVYIGPKKTRSLTELGSGAEKLVDFGFFTIVAKPLLWFLKLTHTVTGNYGVDILIMSILIKIIFLPLTQISFKSMKEMQKVQPEMNRLKEMYKNDKARVQQEIMLLYKRRKINPMSGCLPMLIQIPVFIALYNALQNAIEMRHAPFFLWIKDLSAKDPIYISPLIMGATMVIQQKMTPTAADPAQAKLFMLMPIMFTFLFLNFPSGLVLYWLVNNVLSIVHQSYLNKRR
jgi:YidC/Oxa1 family membrane protein insertase